MAEVLRDRFELSYGYTRSVGPVIGRFLTGLARGRILGIRMSDGRVLVPPTEYDPLTSEELDEFVEVGTAGEVVTCAWVHQPREKHPLDRPFAWALIRLDGADVAMLHAVDAGDESRVRAGTRVQVRWRAEREGHIRDIECFEPERAGGGLMADARVDKVETIVTPISFEYQYSAGTAASVFLHGLRQGRIIGQRCPECSKVYVPPRGSCPRCGVATTGEVPVQDTGTVFSFTVVHLPLPGSELDPPFVTGILLLDGADQTCMHLVAGCDPGEVRIGMRVRAVWRPREQWGYTFENVRYFEPSGEPDVPTDELLESYLA
jgi:uncharacterized OB-fold protein